MGRERSGERHGCDLVEAASAVLIGCLLIAVLGGCASPVGVRRVDPRAVQRELAESVLTSDRMSADPQRPLIADLEEDAEKRPRRSSPSFTTSCFRTLSEGRSRGGR